MTLPAFFESLTVPQGGEIGQNLRIMPWQSRLFDDIQNPHYRQVALSCGRGNGKSCLMAAVALHRLIYGPANADVVVIASSFAQGKDILGRFIRFWGKGLNLRFLDSMNRWECHNRETGTRVLVKASDPKRMHGLAPSLILADEPAQWGHYSRPMYTAISTSLGKIPDSKLCAFSTRPEAGTWFDSLLKSKDKATAVHLYSADRFKHLFRVEAMKRANPSWDYFPVLRDQIKAEARIARKDNGALPGYKSYRLNLPLEANREMIVSLNDWKKLDHHAPRKGPVVVGIDLGHSASLTAATCLWPESHRVEVYAACGSDPSPADRARRDGSAYPSWIEAGDLWLFSGKTTPVSGFMERLAGALHGEVVRHVGCDDYRHAELVDALQSLELGWPAAKFRRGQHQHRAGGAYDIRSFQRAVLDGRLHVTRGRSMLEAAISQSSLKWDSAGNCKLDQAKRTGRIDCLSSAVIACGAAAAMPRKRSRYLGLA